MTFHRNQAQFVSARWRRAILFPIWVFQTVLLLAILGVFSYRLAETAEHFDENRKAGKVPTVELAWEVTNVSLGVLCLVLTIMEAARLLAETLTPYFLLACHIIKMTCAAAMLALDIVVYINRSEGNWSTIGLALDVALLAAMLALFGYAIVTYRRLVQSYDDYYHDRSRNTKAFGYGNRYDEIELGGPGARTSTSGLVGNSAAMGSASGGGGGVASGDVFLRAGPYNDGPTEYDPAAAAVGAGGESTGRSRSHSAASSARGSPSRAVGGPPGALDDNNNSRRASYNHERDTQFDSYVMNRASAALSKDDVDRAIHAELWGTAARPPSGGPIGPMLVSTNVGAAHTTGGVGGVERSNSVVATGTVASHQAIPATTPQREAINRTVSWSVEHGLVSVPESLNEDYDGTNTLQTVGSVATIAEEYEGAAQTAHAYGERAQDENEVDVDALAHGRYRTKRANEDRALLMGHSRQGSLEEDEEDDERGPIPETIHH